MNLVVVEESSFNHPHKSNRGGETVYFQSSKESSMSTMLPAPTTQRLSHFQKESLETTT